MPPASRTLGPLLLVVAAASMARQARAQVSEADRQAARDLFQAGYQLQQAGNYAEALDKFKRAQAVFSAPTNLLHVAECEAQLGLLVESAETYRGLIAMPLPPGAPTAFSAAQTQGKAELQQVEARIPKIHIEVAPANAQNVGVTIDEQPMNTALLGVDRPIDPGTHKVHVFAPNYAPQDKTVVIKEKEPPKVVAFTLVPGGSGIVYGPAPGTVPVGQPTTTVVVPQGVVVQPPVVYGPYGAQVQQPYVYTPRPWTPPKHDWTYTGFLFGLRAAGTFPSGSASGADSGGEGGLEGYFRFAHKWFVGVLAQHDFYGAPGGYGSTLAAADIGFTTNPEGVGFTMDLFGGSRFFSNGSSSGEGGIGAGIWIAAGKSIRIIPRAEISGGGLPTGALPPSSGSSGTASGGYGIFTAGVSLLYNIDIKAKATETPAASPAETEPAKPN